MPSNNSDNLAFLVTVTYRCESMIDAETLRDDYNNDPLEAYECITDSFKDGPENFGDRIPRHRES